MNYFCLTERNAQQIFVKQNIFGTNDVFNGIFFWGGLGTSVLSFLYVEKRFGTLARYLFGKPSFILDFFLKDVTLLETF